MAIAGLNSSIASNRIRIVYLVALMPLLVFLCLYFWFGFVGAGNGEAQYLESEKKFATEQITNVESAVGVNGSIEANEEVLEMIDVVLDNRRKVFELEQEANSYLTNTTTTDDRYYSTLQEAENLNNLNIKLFQESVAVDNLSQLKFYQVMFERAESAISDLPTSFEKSIEVLLWSLPLILLWLVVGVSMQKKIIFGFTGAKEITRKESPEIYNLVENLCISRGIPTPKIGIMEDRSLNAFATGWTKKDSWLVFSRGILEKLNKDEIEAVAGHELTHIINEDVKTMVIVNVFIGIIGTIGYILMRTGGGGNNKKGNPLIFLGIALYLLSLIVLPLINLAVSRRKEFIADAGSVQLTMNREGMISALKKISGHSVIEKVKSKDSGIASMFISDPIKHNIFSGIKSLFATHPPIKDRIEALEKY